MMLSANTDPELRAWLRWAAEGGNTPMFVRRIARAACLACWSDFEMPRSVLARLKRRYPDDPSPGHAADATK